MRSIDALVKIKRGKSDGQQVLEMLITASHKNVTRPTNFPTLASDFLSP
jgi:hypothetical protein